MVECVLLSPTCDKPTVISQSIYKLLEQGPVETGSENEKWV